MISPLIIYVLLGIMGRYFQLTCNPKRNIDVLVHSFANGVLLSSLVFLFLKEVYTLPAIFTGLLILSLSIMLACSRSVKARLLFEVVHLASIGLVFANAHSFIFLIPFLFAKLIGSFKRLGEEKESTALLFLQAIPFLTFFVYPFIGITIANLALAIATGGIFYTIITMIFGRVRVNLVATYLGLALFFILSYFI